jgi:hypothetical protein
MFRVAIAEKITAAGLSPGEFRPLSPEEVHWLRKVSAPDYQNRKRQATQKWYERKEMEKERKRLQQHAAANKTVSVRGEITAAGTKNSNRRGLRRWPNRR